jgi:hypothetical protein
MREPPRGPVADILSEDKVVPPREPPSSRRFRPAALGRVMVCGAVAGLALLGVSGGYSDERTDRFTEPAKSLIRQPTGRRPASCDDDWLAARANHYLPWAEAARLRRGDPLIRLGGIAISPTSAFADVNSGTLADVEAERGDRFRLLCRHTRNAPELQPVTATGIMNERGPAPKYWHLVLGWLTKRIGKARYKLTGLADDRSFKPEVSEKGGRESIADDVRLQLLVVTPLLIGTGSVLAGRQWGQAVSGWLVGLPFTSGPVAFLLAFDHGVGFALAAAAGSVAGAIGETAFVVAYARCAARLRWPGALAAGSIAFAAMASGLQLVEPPLVVLLPALFVALALALWLMPSDVEAALVGPLQRWHLPACIVTSTVLVIVLTGAAPVLGPGWSGMLASYPVYAGILTVFAHHVSGSRAGVQVLRGLLLGLFAFGGFFAVLATLLARRGLAVAFLAATAVALAIQGCSLGLMLAVRRRRPPRSRHSLSIRASTVSPDTSTTKHSLSREPIDGSSRERAAVRPNKSPSP